MLKDIPCGDKTVFPESVFYLRQDPSKTALPSPTAVREEGARQNGAAAAKGLNRPPPVRFPSLGLFVKYGALVSVAEAQCMILVRKHLPSIPTPEVYGWQNHGEQVFIYMELVEGSTLEELWDDLTQRERVDICSELRGFVTMWRGLRQKMLYDGDTPYIGNVVRDSLLDWIFVNTCSVGAGPFCSVSQFHDWFTTAYGPNRLGSREGRSPHPFRTHLPDDVPILFTHADLHPSNILVTRKSSGNSAPRIAAVIDWQQAGWYPAYWEYCKSRWAWSAKVGVAWRETYLRMILDAGPYEGECYDYWDHFVIARGI